MALSERSESICGKPRMDGRVSSGRVSDGKRGIWGWAVYICQIFYGGASSPPGRSAEWRRIKIVWPLTSRPHARSCHKLLDREITSFTGIRTMWCASWGSGVLRLVPSWLSSKVPTSPTFPIKPFFEATRARLNINEGQQR